MKSSTMEEREKMFGSTMYIKLSGDYNKIDEKKGNYQTQGHPKIPDKRGRDSNRR